MDVSSYQPTDLTLLIAEHRIEHVVVRLYVPGEEPPQDISRAQIASARANGCTVGGYMWAYAAFDPVVSVGQVLSLARNCGEWLPVLWIDWEEYEGEPVPDFDWILRAVNQCHAYPVRPGIYSRYGWLMEHLTGGQRQSLIDLGVVLWLAQYDGQQTLDDVQMPSWWPRGLLLGKQYQGDPIDLNVFKREVRDG